MRKADLAAPHCPHPTRPVATTRTIGVERAIRYARTGEPWVSRDQEADMGVLLAAEMARRSRR